MDVLIQLLDPYDLPGVEIENDYSQLRGWLKHQNERCSIRLRQEIALILVNNWMNQASDIYSTHQAAHGEFWKLLYGELVRAYPFIYENDTSATSVKNYGARVKKLVDESIALGLAIKGQEMDIVPATVKEGEQKFDVEIMVDVDGQKSGIMQLCICPPFIIRGFPRRKLLKKGRVLCSPSVKSN